MPRYIDADKLAEHKFSSVTYDRYASNGGEVSDEEVYAYKIGYNSAIESIAQFEPTADVVEVVRCKDCVWYDERIPFAYSHALYKCRNLERFLPPDFFCKDGKRRDDEESTKRTY